MYKVMIFFLYQLDLKEIDFDYWSLYYKNRKYSINKNILFTLSNFKKKTLH